MKKILIAITAAATLSACGGTADPEVVTVVETVPAAPSYSAPSYSGEIDAETAELIFRAAGREAISQASGRDKVEICGLYDEYPSLVTEMFADKFGEQEGLSPQRVRVLTADLFDEFCS